MLFRGTAGNPLGTTGNPLQISVRKKTVKRVLLAVVILAVVQVGVLVQYVSQTTQVTNQGAELEGLKAELSQSREQAVGFSEAIDNMQERVLTIQTINEKLQVMFGLKPEKAQDADAEGQGGEEVSYAAGGLGIRDGESLTEDGTASSPATPGPGWRRTSKGGWPGSSDTPRANSTCWPGWKKQRENGLACGPRSRPSGPSKATCPQGRTTHFTLYRQKGIPCGHGYQWPTRENRASPRQRQSGGGCL